MPSSFQLPASRTAALVATLIVATLGDVLLLVVSLHPLMLFQVVDADVPICDDGARDVEILVDELAPLLLRFLLLVVLHVSIVVDVVVTVELVRHRVGYIVQRREDQDGLVYLLAYLLRPLQLLDGLTQSAVLEECELANGQSSLHAILLEWEQRGVQILVVHHKSTFHSLLFLLVEKLLILFFSVRLS